MSLNPENKYEDSCQKEERLRGELKFAISDVRASFGVYAKDSKEVSSSFEKLENINQKIDELIKQEQGLEEELMAKQTELAKIGGLPDADIDNKIDSSLIVSLEIGSIREKISGILDEVDALIREMDKIFEEQRGMVGDSEGSKAVIEIKMKKIEDLKKQLDELRY